MTDQRSSSAPFLKLVLAGAGILVFFGFLVLILSGYVGRESSQERAYQGDFDEETIETRWNNLEEVKTAQEELVDPANVDSALDELAKAPPEPAKTEVVVPGSPTFMKQSQEKPSGKEASGKEPSGGKSSSGDASPTGKSGEGAQKGGSPEGDEKAAEGSDEKPESGSGESQDSKKGEKNEKPEQGGRKSASDSGKGSDEAAKAGSGSEKKDSGKSGGDGAEKKNEG